MILRIKNIKINHYGNLENRDIHLANSINIIYGRNESGKSTLLSYIKNILYGISKNKSGKEVSDYERYKPWTTEEFCGKLKYELDSGEVFEVFRDFNKKNPKIFNENLEDISKEFQIDKKEGSQFFFEQTKVDELMFLSTIMSMQQEVRLDKQSQQILVQKIANLAGTGDDNVSFKKVLDRLNKRQLDEIGTERTQGKPINVVKDRLKKIDAEIKQLEFYQNNKDNLEIRKRNLEQKVSELEIRNRIATRLNNVYLALRLEEEKINLKSSIQCELQEKIHKLEEEKNELLIEKINLEDKRQNSRKEKQEETRTGKRVKETKRITFIVMFLIVIMLFVGVQLINQFYFKNQYLSLFSFALIPIYFIYVLIRLKIDKNKEEKVKYQIQLDEQIEEEKVKNEFVIFDTKIESIEKQIEQLMQESKEQSKEIKQIELQIDAKIDYEIEIIKQENHNQININEVLENFNRSSIQNQVSVLQEELGQSKLALHSVTIEEKEIIPKLENMISLKEKYKSFEEELFDLEEKNHCILLAKEYLNKAYEKMKKEITPKFTDNLSRNIANTSSGKYTRVSIHDKGIMVENELGDYISVDRLSIGTIDQLYLALRLSMIDEISEESMPIILDEAFAYYDEERLENILTFLTKQLTRHQLIIFTCTNREKDILNKLQVSYNLVELS